MRPGPRNLITDVSGLRVGNADDAGLKSGVTVLTPTALRGRGPCHGRRARHARDRPSHPDRMVEDVDAVFLSGGSAFGLDAGGGVMQALREAGRGFPVGPVRVPVVPGAIVFDLLNGGDKDWTDNPYPALGRSAFLAAAPDFTLAPQGRDTGR